MLDLPHGCMCSELAVHPQNWEKGKPDINSIWYIHYRFYDPLRTKPKQVVIKGMNEFRTIAERREATKRLLRIEKDLLIHQGYNPFLKKAIAPIDIEYEIHPSLPFIKALRKALERLDITDRCRVQIKSVINGLDKAAGQLDYRDIEISQLTRRHIKILIDQSSKNARQWSNHRFNAYRGYLMMLFKELVELEAVPLNPIRDISKKAVSIRIKPTLNEQQRRQIDDHLAAVFPAFRNFIHLFFHSGGRKPELLQLKPSMIDLARQKYRCVVKKGKQYREVERTIKSIAIPYWEYFLNNCPDDHFIFGPLFKPGLQSMGEDMPTKYWRKHIKTELKIPIDFYSLKHLNTSEVVDALDEAAAAALNAHQSTAMVVKIYDVKQKDRQHEKLKGVNNSFA